MDRQSYGSPMESMGVKGISTDHFAWCSDHFGRWQSELSALGWSQLIWPDVWLGMAEHHEIPHFRTDQRHHVARCPRNPRPKCVAILGRRWQKPLDHLLQMELPSPVLKRVLNLPEAIKTVGSS